MTRAPICQSFLPVRPWAQPHTARLPGLTPVTPGEWLLVDEVYAEQLAYRDHLIATSRETVHALDAAARPAALELLDAILREVLEKPGFSRDGAAVTRPDGHRVPLDRDDPLVTAGRLVQEDLLILQKPDGGAEHLLTGGVLCFPASWTLAEKMGRPLTAIHVPVESYDPSLAARVQRLFDGLQPGRAIWRGNNLVYADPDLHQPRREGEKRPVPEGARRWLRVERQVLVRLPRTGAVAFTIHTYVVPFDQLTEEDRAAMAGRSPVT